MAAQRAPAENVAGGVGSTIMVHGNDEQKKHYIPKILNGEMRFCQGYSEPGAGSDLASLQTRAHRDGGEFVIRSEEHTSELQSLMRNSYAVFRLKKKKYT